MSHFEDGQRINVFQVGNFTLPEATEFVKDTLKIEDAVGKDKDLIQFPETLHFFPLAIKHATVYISKTIVKMDNIGSAVTIDK